jgi:hypothetical protein
LANGVRGTTYNDTQVPDPGQGFFYLIQGQNWESACGLGTLGFSSSEFKRANTALGACQGTTVTDVVATAETTFRGYRFSGDYHDTQNADQVYERVDENFYTDSWQLDQRYGFTVGSGSVKELHVKGYVPNTQENEGFSFALSSNGGSTWFPITMSGALLGNSSYVDLVGTLSPGVTSFQIRIMDTLRTLHEYNDAMYIDKIWVRVAP